MDLLGANILGMILGRVTLWLCQTKQYDWSGKKGKKMGYLRFALRQFTPISWDQYHWEVFSSFSRFAQVRWRSCALETRTLVYNHSLFPRGRSFSLSSFASLPSSMPSSC